MKNAFSPRRRWLRHSLLALSMASTVWGAPAVAADAWPSRAIKVVVSFPPGNSADVIARDIAPELSKRLGQPVVVENRAGAGGIIGVDAVAKAAPTPRRPGTRSASRPASPAV